MTCRCQQANAARQLRRGGKRQLRKLLSGASFRAVRLEGSRYAGVADPAGSDDASFVQLDRSEYTEVR